MDMSDVSISVPARLEGFIAAPALIRDRDLPWTVHDMIGGAAEKAKPVATRDYVEVIGRCLASGEQIEFPRGEYPIRQNQVTFTSDTPIHLSGRRGAVIIPGKELPTIVGGLLSMQSVSKPPDAQTRLTIEGLRFDATEITAEKGRNLRSGLSFLAFFKYYRPLVQNCSFFGGRLPIDIPGNNPMGTGYMDTAIEPHGCYGTIIRDFDGEGFADLFFYDSGTKITGVLDDAFTTIAGSPIVTIVDKDHPALVGAYVDIVPNTAEQAVGSLTLLGPYRVTAILDANTYQIDAGTPAATAETGGDVVTIFYDFADVQGQRNGEETVLMDGDISWCGNGIAFKRNLQNATVTRVRIQECDNGISCINVGSPAGATYGGRVRLYDNRLIRIRSRPMRITGPDCHIFTNTIENYGKEISGPNTGVAFTASGSSIQAIAAISAPGARIHNNAIRQTGAWAAKPGDAGVLVAIALGKWAVYPYGSTECRVRDNHIEGVHRPIIETTGAENNCILDNPEIGALFASSITSSTTRFGRTIYANGLTGAVEYLDLTGSPNPAPAYIQADAVSGRAALSSYARDLAGRVHQSFCDTNGKVLQIATNGGNINFNYGPTPVAYLDITPTGWAYRKPIYPITNNTQSIGTATARFAAGWFTNMILGPGIGIVVTPANNGDLIFEVTSNTSVKLKLKGSDGTVRSSTLTLT